MENCSATVVDASSSSDYKNGDLKFGVSVEGCPYSRVRFTVDIIYSNTKREYQTSSESGGKREFEVKASVDEDVQDVSEPRDIRCDCIG